MMAAMFNAASLRRLTKIERKDFQLREKTLIAGLRLKLVFIIFVQPQADIVYLVSNPSALKREADK